MLGILSHNEKCRKAYNEVRTCSSGIWVSKYVFEWIIKISTTKGDRIQNLFGTWNLVYTILWNGTSGVERAKNYNYGHRD